MNLPDNTQRALQSFYVSIRELSSLGFPRRGLQKAFEELVYSFIKKDSWRPTHITKEALRSYVEGTDLRLQRAHGSFRDRMDRFERTMEIIEGDERTFSEWWSFFLYHDKTVLMTRREHGSGIKPSLSDLIPTPDVPTGMFENAGFKAKIRKKIELEWMKKVYDDLQKNTK